MTLQLSRTIPLGVFMVANSEPLSAAGAGDLLRRRREDKKLTQDQVADLMNVDKSYISKLEGGVHNVARSKYLPKIAAVLGLSEDDIRAVNPGAVFEVASPSPTMPPEPRPLPDGLQSAIDLYGKRFSDLLDPAWQQYMAKFRWRTGQPEDAEAWLDLYRDLSRAGIVPGDG